MKAVVKTKPGKGFTYKEMPSIKNVKRGEVKIKMIYSSICGTDVHINQWDDWSKKTIKTPQINGHEGVGQVVEIGPGVKNVKKGDFVSYETHYYCEKCTVCKQGNIHVCKKMTILGVHMDGTWGEEIKIPSKLLFKIPKTRKVPLKYCGILEPFGNAHHTLSYTDLKGKNVLISGDGPIGIFGALIAKAKGAKTVHLTGASTFRLNLAKKCGIKVIDVRKTKNLKATIDKLTKGQGIDAIGEYSGAPIALQNMIDIINPGGYIGVLSVYSKNKFDIEVNELVFKNINMQFICGRKIFETWEDSFKLINTGKIKLSAIDKIVTHEFALKDYQKGFKAIESGKAGKVLLKIGNDPTKNMKGKK